MKPTAVIRNWELITCRDGSLMIKGNVYNDDKDRWKDGTLIYVTEIDYFENNIAVTCYGVFLLED